MALWQITIPKHITADPTGERWTNVYYCAADDATGAITVGSLVAGIEANVHYNSVTIGPVDVRLPGVPGSGRRGSTSFAGVLDPSTLGGTLPLFCTVRVDFPPADGTRAERKYLRLPGNQENTQNGGLWSDELTDYVQLNYADGLAAFVSLRAPNGAQLGPGIVRKPIQMRQLDWHRRTRPGYHRGWVPDV